MPSLLPPSCFFSEVPVGRSQQVTTAPGTGPRSVAGAAQSGQRLPAVTMVTQCPARPGLESRQRVCPACSLLRSLQLGSCGRASEAHVPPERSSVIYITPPSCLPPGPLAAGRGGDARTRAHTKPLWHTRICTRTHLHTHTQAHKRHTARHTRAHTHVRAHTSARADPHTSAQQYTEQPGMCASEERLG